MPNITNQFTPGDLWQLKGEHYFRDAILSVKSVHPFGVIFSDKAQKTTITTSHCFGLPPLEYYLGTKQLRRVTDTAVIHNVKQAEKDIVCSEGVTK